MPVHAARAERVCTRGLATVLSHSDENSRLSIIESGREELLGIDERETRKKKIKGKGDRRVAVVGGKKTKKKKKEK